MWRGNWVTDHKSDLTIAANSMVAQAHERAVRAAELENQFYRVAEFDALFHKEIHRELAPLRQIDYKINLISGSSWILTYWPSGYRLKHELTANIHREEISHRVYGPEEDTTALVISLQHKRDSPKEHRFLLDCRPRNPVTIQNDMPLSNIEQAIEFVAARPL